jgi:DNA helicase IV
MNKLVSEKFLPFLNMTSYLTIFAFFCLLTFLTIDHVRNYNTIPSIIKIYTQDEIVTRQNNINSHLNVTWEIDRLRICKVKVTRIIYDIQNKLSIETYSEVRYIDQIEKIRSEAKIIVPNYLIDSLYYYHSKLNYFCSLSSYIFGPKTIYTPKVFFRIKSI